MGKEQRIQDRLKWDERLWLEYGRPLEAIPYREIAQFLDDGSEPDSVLHQACQIVEKEKDKGRPRAFVTSEYDGDFNLLYRVWGWPE